MKALVNRPLAELLAMSGTDFNKLVADAAKLTDERKGAQKAEKDSTVPVAKVYFAAGDRLEKAKQGGFLAADTSLEDYIRIVLKDPKHRVNNHALTVKNAFGYFVANGGPLAEETFDGCAAKWLELAGRIGSVVFKVKLGDIPEDKRRAAFLVEEAVTATVKILAAASLDKTGKGASKTAKAQLEVILEAVSPTAPPDWEDVKEELFGYMKVPTIFSGTLHLMAAQLTYGTAEPVTEATVGAFQLLAEAMAKRLAPAAPAPAPAPAKPDCFAWAKSAYDGIPDDAAREMVGEVEGFVTAHGRLPATADEFDIYMEGQEADGQVAQAT